MGRKQKPEPYEGHYHAYQSAEEYRAEKGIETLSAQLDWLIRLTYNNSNRKRIGDD